MTNVGQIKTFSRGGELVCVLCKYEIEISVEVVETVCTTDSGSRGAWRQRAHEGVFVSDANVKEVFWSYKPHEP